MTRGAGLEGSKIGKKKLSIFLYLLLVIIAVPIVFYIFVGSASLGKVKSLEEVEPRDVAIVFGAGLTRSGAATAILKDRVETGVQLYFTGKVQKILMTGDNRFENYNEPQAMKDYALGLGVPEEDIVLDYAGRRTYDSCYRAREIFQVKTAILVTQQFHMSRALYLCDTLGLDAVGVAANNREYRQSSYIIWNMREFLARNVALKDIILRPIPVLGEIEPIILEEL